MVRNVIEMNWFADELWNLSKLPPGLLYLSCLLFHFHGLVSTNLCVCVLSRRGNSSFEYTKFYIEKFDRTLWEESIEWLNGHPGHGLGCRKNF